MKEPKEVTCWETKELAYSIKLTQYGPESFAVYYGKQVIRGLCYADAACELGNAIMHALACEDKLDNTEIK
jgi:hypothetical protein